MSEIKFRCWSKDDKEMFNVIALAFPVGRADCIVSGKGGSVNSKNAELMQFTGLHDKNGKEIYEGDIVRDCNESDLVFTVEWDSENGGYWMPEKFSEEGHYPISHVVLEVMGNIYENPELITPSP